MREIAWRIRCASSPGCTGRMPRARTRSYSPPCHSIMTAAQFDQMGDKFEDKEQELFGKSGFEKIVAEVAGMEKALGIEDLNQFTAKE